MSRQSISYTTASQDGTIEFPSNSNKTTYGKWYGLIGVKWFCIFVGWVYDHAGHQRGESRNYTWLQVQPVRYVFWKRNGCVIKDPQPGDTILCNWGGDDICDHTGILVKRVKTLKLHFWYGTETLK